MSGRLVRSFAVMTVRLQMSGRFRVFAFVESGTLDPAFYDGILQATLSGSGREYAIVTGDSLDEEGRGGKPKLLDFYAYLRKKRKLNQRNRQNTVSALFFLDRDFDHLYGSHINSPHVLRTGLYNVEAEIMVHAVQWKGLRLALSLPEDQAKQLATDLADWQTDLAVAWSEWLQLCVLSVALGSGCSIKPKSMSTIQVGKYGAVDRRKLATARKTVLQSATCACSGEVVSKVEAATSSCIAKEGSALTLLNGKHLPAYLEIRVRKHPIGSRANVKGMAGAAARCFLSALDFRHPWALPYRQAILKLIR